VKILDEDLTLDGLRMIWDRNRTGTVRKRT
jgi:hypothetical protein